MSRSFNTSGLELCLACLTVRVVSLYAFIQIIFYQNRFIVLFLIQITHLNIKTLTVTFHQITKIVTASNKATRKAMT